jgi:hypothetical protein
MKYYRKAAYYDAIFSLNEYREKIGKFQKADLAFQANMFSRWDESQKSDYISSLITNLAPSKFIFADVKACLAAAEKRGEIEDVKYFQSWLDKGVLYLNIDSNNRNNIILSFLNDEVAIPHGKYDLGDAVATISKYNDVYSRMPQVMKDSVDQAFITVSVYTDATRKELSDLFKKVNDGKPLNHAEILNSFITITANTVRDLTEKYALYFVDQKKWFGKVAINRRGIDDFVAGMAYVFAYSLDSTISKKSMENFYREGSDGEQQMRAFRRAFEDFMDNVMTEDAYAIANRNSVFDLFVIYLEMRNEGLVIKDNNKFLKEYIKAVSSLLVSKERYDHEDFNDPKSFETLVGGRQKTNNIIRNRLIKELFDFRSLCEKRDSKRTFNTTEKMILAVNGNFKTPEGKEIDLSRLHTNDYHGGHVVPHSQSGETTIENGVIQTAEDNLKLGGKVLEAV